MGEPGAVIGELAFLPRDRIERIERAAKARRLRKPGIPVSFFSVPSDWIAPAKLPARLCHRENLEHLTGFGRFLGFQAAANETNQVEVADALEESLRHYAEQTDLLKLMRLDSGCLGFPDLHLRIIPEGGPNRYSVRHAINHNRSVRYELPPGPQLTIGRRRPDGGSSWVVASLLPILSSSPSCERGYTVYAHTFDEERAVGVACRTGFSYIGVTKRDWAARWREHCASARGGSPYHFHRAMREHSTWVDVHQIISIRLSHQEAMATEERLVKEFTLYPNGLNMIPGGFAGIRYLAKLGFTASRKHWENRHLVLQNFAAHCERAGKPNPLLAMRWRDDAFAASIICANPNNFDADEVSEIRLLDSLGWLSEQIAARLQCSEDRVCNLLRGETYARVH